MLFGAGGAPDAVKALGETAFLLKLGSKTGDLTILKKSLLVNQADHYIARYPGFDVRVVGLVRLVGHQDCHKLTQFVKGLRNGAFP